MRTRACGVVLREGKLLLQRKRHETIWALPGGKLEDGETVEAALAREFMEELGWEVQVGPQLWMLENAFELAGEPISQIEYCFLLHVEEPPEVIVPHDQTLAFCWASRVELERLDFRPAGLKGALLETDLL